ncbi:hypothetical protein [Komagataeibacter oboediens]|uniref:hypothetical protein n=1 Tax=Komagataeibacter oboediens TaxID=65958 RepID=UPI0027DA2B0C|nr:hypothetical protein [Komagataeibacter oboediens]
MKMPAIPHRNVCADLSARNAERRRINDAAPFYRHAPEAVEARQGADSLIARFMHEILPDASDMTRDPAGGLITTTCSAVGKVFPKHRELMRTSRLMPAAWPTCLQPI